MCVIMVCALWHCATAFCPIVHVRSRSSTVSASAHTGAVVLRSAAAEHAVLGKVRPHVLVRVRAAGVCCMRHKYCVGGM